jgi:hypothetical protein
MRMESNSKVRHSAYVWEIVIDLYGEWKGIVEDHNKHIEMVGNMIKKKQLRMFDSAKLI